MFDLGSLLNKMFGCLLFGAMASVAMAQTLSPIPTLCNTGWSSTSVPTSGTSGQCGTLIVPPSTGGTVDPNWTVYSQPVPTSALSNSGTLCTSEFTGAPPPPITGQAFVDLSVWSSDGPKSDWLTPLPSTLNGYGGCFAYQTTFTIPPGYLASTGSISGVFNSDNEGYSIYLNGKLVQFYYGVWDTPTSPTNIVFPGPNDWRLGEPFLGSFTLNSLTVPLVEGAAFQVGLNQLVFVIRNRGIGGDDTQQTPTSLRVVFTSSSVSTVASVVTNAASNLGGPIAPGEIVVLYGSGLGPAQLTSASVGSNGLYGAALAGTGVQFNGIAAPMIYTSATQVAAIVPYEVTGTSAQVTVTYQGQTSASATVAVAGSAPGLFTGGSTGQGQAAAVNQNGSINSSSTPVPIGSIISLFASGEGQTSPAGVDGKPATTPLPTPILPVNVTIGGVTVNDLQYVGGAPGEVAGLLQINVAIPAGVTPGSAVPVVIRVGGATSQAGVTIAVSAK